MENNFRDFVLKWGLVLGFIEVAISLIAYLMGLEWLVSFTFGFLSIAVAIAGPIYCGVLWKKQQGGYISFKTAFIAMFLVFAASGFVSLGYNVIMYSVIDPSIPEKMKEAVIEKTYNMMEKFGVPEEDIEKTMEEIEEQEMQFSPPALIKSYFLSYIWGAIIALIGAAIIKKNKPVFDQSHSPHNAVGTR